jgi:hypothetical protein
MKLKLFESKSILINEVYISLRVLIITFSKKPFENEKFN